MICQKCKNKGVLNTVLGNDFYYCRTCKVEIDLESADLCETSNTSDRLPLPGDSFLCVQTITAGFVMGQNYILHSWFRDPLTNDITYAIQRNNISCTCFTEKEFKTYFVLNNKTFQTTP